MKKILFLSFLAIAPAMLMAQSKKDKVKPVTQVPEVHDLKIGSADLSVVTGAARLGIHEYLMGTDIPAKQIPAYEKEFEKFLDKLDDQRNQWNMADRALADSLAAVKAKQDSLKSKPKK